jgi:hypothetical protein
MKAVRVFGLALAAVALVGVAGAEEALKSGLQVGEELPAYYVVKAAGAANDGVEEGSDLCYRCKLGNRPVVMVFARKNDEKLATLVKELDKVVAKNSDKKMASFVNLLGEDKDALNSEAKKLIEKSKAENIAVVVPVDNEKGPEAYKINPEADLTVLIYKNGTVEANHALPAGKLSEKEVKKIIEDTSKILQ